MGKVVHPISVLGRPTPTDYMCDLVLAARSVLDEVSFNRFIVALHNDETPDLRVQLALGTVFERKGLWPLGQYFRYVPEPLP